MPQAVNKTALAKRRENKAADALLALCLSAMIATSHGAENESEAEDEDTFPDLELLEFLGQFETDEGQWMPPSSLLADEFELILEATKREPEIISDNDNNQQRNRR